MSSGFAFSEKKDQFARIGKRGRRYDVRTEMQGQSYAILDARTPGIVNIISNKNCKEWRIDALRKK